MGSGEDATMELPCGEDIDIDIDIHMHMHIHIHLPTSREWYYSFWFLGWWMAQSFLSIDTCSPGKVTIKLSWRPWRWRLLSLLVQTFRVGWFPFLDLVSRTMAYGPFLLALGCAFSTVLEMPQTLVNAVTHAAFLPSVQVIIPDPSDIWKDISLL